MTQLLSKREIDALRKQHEKAVTVSVKSSIKGSGWKPKLAYSFVCREIGEAFVECSFRRSSPEWDCDLILECAIKPMRADPLFWEITDISGNENQPLSFRSTGAHTCTGLTLYDRQIPGGDAAEVGRLFREYIDGAPELLAGIAGSFADEVARERGRAVHRDRALFETHALALILENRWSEADFVLRDGLERNLSSHHSYYQAEVQKRGEAESRPFAEMALNWLASHKHDRRSE